MDGLMMDFPLTLTHLLRRAEQFFGDGEIVTRMPDKSFHRTNYRETMRALAAARGRAEEGRARARRPRRDALLEPPPAPRGVLRHPVRRLRPPHAQPPPPPGRPRVHRDARERQGRHRRPRAAAAAREFRDRDADRARLRRRGLVRGAARDRRPGRVGGSAARRERGRGDVLHERHDRPAARRRLLAPLVRPPRARRRREQPARHGLRRRRRGAAGRADVPRERLGLPVPRDDAGREARLPRPAPRPRLAARGHGAGEGHVGGRRADDLDGDPRAARRGARQVGSLRDEGDARRRLGRAARDDRGVRVAARAEDHPGLGHDRDLAGRLDGRAPPRPRGGRRGHALGLPGDGRHPAPARRDPRARRRRGRAVGRRGDGRARGARAVGRGGYSTRRRAPTAGRPTAGSGPATSSRSTRAATSRSRTARRT